MELKDLKARAKKLIDFYYKEQWKEAERFGYSPKPIDEDEAIFIIEQLLKEV